MKLFFKAKKATGETIEGVKEASDKFAVARELRSEGLVPISVMPEMTSTPVQKYSLSSLFHHVSLKDKIVFAGNLSAMISAGLSLGRALSVLEKQTGNQYFKEVIGKIGEKINAGNGLSSALALYPKIFPPVFVAMVGAAEESGNLPESLKIVSEQLTKTYDLHRKVRGAMIYPAIIIMAIIVIGILMMIFLIPTLTATFKDLGAQLPLSTQIVITASDILINHYFIILSLVTLLVIMFLWGLRSQKGKEFLDQTILRLPVFGELSRKINSAVILRTTASLVASGVSMIKSIDITKQVVQNTAYQRVLVSAGENLQKGFSLSSVFKENEKLFPIFASEMTSVGEETGKLPEMMLKGAVFFEDEVDQATKNLSTIIEPALMVVIGLAVGFFAVSMLGPMYSLSDIIK